MGAEQPAVVPPKQALPERAHPTVGPDGQPVADEHKRPEFVAGLIPGVSREKEGQPAAGDRKTASEQAYQWVVNPHEAKDKRGRGQLGPEEQGDFAKPYE